MVEQESESMSAQALLPISVQLVFVPTVLNTPSEKMESQSVVPETTNNLIDRENQRIEHRAARLNQVEEFAGAFIFEPWRDDSFAIYCDPANPVIDEELFTQFLRESSSFADLLNPEPNNSISIIFTNGQLVNNHLALLVGRAACVSLKPVSHLTAELLKDPWNALILLFYTEIADGFFGQYQLNKDANFMTNFQAYWHPEAVKAWIERETPNEQSQGEQTLDAFKDQFGEATEKLKALIRNLPAPGSLDEKDLKLITYSDPSAKVDLLNLDKYTSGFKQLILHRETTTPLTIAVIGEWGKGKSSFMRFLRDGLEAHRTPAKISTDSEESPLAPRAVTIWFDAWQYDSEEKILAALLQTVGNEVEAHFSAYSWLNYRFELALSRVLTSWSTTYHVLIVLFSIPIFLVIAMTLVLVFGNQISGANGVDIVQTLLKQSGALGFSSTGLAILYLAWRMLKTARIPLGININQLLEKNDHSARLGFLSVFQKDFALLVEQMRRMPSWSLQSTIDGLPVARGFLAGLGRLGLDIGNGLFDSIKRRSRWLFPLAREKRIQQERKYKEKGNRIIIFIDDLDRCRSEKITGVLEAIKGTLDMPGLVFILGMDEHYVKSGIYLHYQKHINTLNSLYPNQYNHEKDSWPENFLEKIIQIPFRLPDARQHDVESLVGGVLDIKSEIQQREVIEGGDGHAAAMPAHEMETKQQKAHFAAEESRMLAEIDSDNIKNMIFQAATELAGFLGGNPRRIKGFINRCRLGLYLLKLHMPDRIETDYQDAIDLFVLWEKQQQTEMGHSLDDMQNLLQEICRCIFKVRELKKGAESLNAR